MTDRIVSLRIPSSLILELKKRVDRDHFKDVSELVRTIIRRRSRQLEGKQAQPEFGGITKEQMIKELERLIERLRE